MKRKLDFLLVGPQRTGSTWLDEALRASGSVQLPSAAKETFFFDENFERGPDWYWSHFEKSSDLPVGEVAPSYFDVAVAADRIHQWNPDCKIILILRDPAERAFSLYLHHRRKGRVPTDLRKAAEAMPRLLTSGQYQNHIPLWWRKFGQESVLILKHDDIISNPEGVLEEVGAFLGIQPGLGRWAVREKVNASSLPRFPVLARGAAVAVTFLKRHRIHSLVDLGKRIGLKKVYSGAAEIPQLSADDRRWLIAQHSGAIDFCQKELEWSVADWVRQEP